jgi:hypothetical protein
VIGAEEALRSAEMPEHNHWLQEALHPNEEHKAFDFEMGRYFAGNTLASDASLGAIYRPSADLARVHFGSTLLQVGPESNNTRLSLSFADTSFHQAWAELIVGWLLTLALRQLQMLVDAAGTIFPLSEEARTAFDSLRARIQAVLSRGDRCSLTEVLDGNDRRYLISGFRRSSSTAPKKVIL